MVGLPSGQDLATAIGATPLIPSDFERSVESDVVAAHGFDRRTPLWFYILKEAQTHADGERLGEVGGRILAEALIGLLEGDPDSFLVAQPDWTRTLPVATQGTFTMADLSRFVEDINPIGPTNLRATEPVSSAPPAA